VRTIVGASPSCGKPKPKNAFVASPLRCIIKDKNQILVGGKSGKCVHRL